MIKKNLRKFGNIIRTFWNAISIMRRFIGNLIFLILIILLLSIFIFGGDTKAPPSGALIISPSGNIVEQKSVTVPLDQLMGRVAEEETLLKDIVDGIDFAREDEKIKALVLDLDDMRGAGLSKLQEIGAALNRFRETGKTIIAAGDTFNQNQYYLAAHAQKIYLHPMGHVFLNGYGLYRKYFKSALEKLMVQIHIFKVGTYKTALEPFLRDDMSEEARDANTLWLNDLWEAYKSDIAAFRGIDANSIDGYINNIIDHLAKVDGDMAKLALELGFVDALKTRDEVQDDLIALVGEDKKNKTYNHIHFTEYLKLLRPEVKQKGLDKQKIGIIIAKGIILDGEQPAGRIGADSLAALIRQARHNDQIKSVVLRIDSGGGSAFASEIIRKEVELTRGAGKPVIVSMSSAAASGGYWIATSANEIWAAPTTLTGSIGIFGAFATFDKTLKHLGINTDGIGTTELTGAFDPSRPFNPILAATIQQTIEQGYKRFIARVSQGRQMSPEKVEKAAQGRIWSGKRALALGLVDQLGNLKDAVQSAAKLSGLEDYEAIVLKRPLSARERILQELYRFIFNLSEFTNISEKHPAVRFYFSIGAELEQFLHLNDPQGMYAYCLTCDVQ